MHVFFKSVLLSKVAVAFEKHSQGPVDKLKQHYVVAVYSLKIVGQALVGSLNAGSVEFQDAISKASSLAESQLDVKALMDTCHTDYNSSGARL